MNLLRHQVVAGVALAGLVVACGGGGTSGPAASEDERGSIGVPPTAGEYCTKLGFALIDSQCTFPDGASCDQWEFYRAKCGQANSYCNQHGGTVSSKTEDMGTWTAVYAVCTLGGKECKDATFMQTGKCE